MSYYLATPNDLKTRFPDFADVDDGVVDGALLEASTRVSTSWTEADYFTGQLLYAAHVLTQDGFGKGREARFSGLIAAGVESIKIASLALSLGKKVSTGGLSGDLATTTYGKRFRELLRLNVPAVAVTYGGP